MVEITYREAHRSCTLDQLGQELQEHERHLMRTRLADTTAVVHGVQLGSTQTVFYAQKLLVASQVSEAPWRAAGSLLV